MKIKMLLLVLLCYTSMYAQVDQPTIISGDTVIINMAALDQPFMYNRLGTAQPTGMIFALENDIVAKNGSSKKAGNVKLKKGKRPRPIVLRANVGDILVINFTNYLRPFIPNQKIEFYDGFPTKQKEVNSLYPATREAGVHIVGTELAQSINDDASFVGSNSTSLAKPGQKKKYVLLAAAEGTFVLHSTGDNIADGTIRAGQISNGLFGSLIVEPPNAEWYRSQVTEDELYQATKRWVKVDANGNKTTIDKPPFSSKEFKQSNKGFPIIDYNAESKGSPILKMYKQLNKHTRELIASDLTALITGPKAGPFPQSDQGPSFYKVRATPNRHEPYREFSIHYHEAPYAVQAFPEFYNNSPDPVKNISQTIQGGVDQFAFNYGTGGIGAEIYANRVKVGPMADCIDCAYEEFFLSAWAIGDPAQVVDIPANATIAKKTNVEKTLQDLLLLEAALLAGIPPTPVGSVINDVKATKVLYPDDPSNVYHSYMNDHVKFRINHCGAGITHVHHQHAHQWLHSPNSDNGHYLDSQTINPGASYTLEMVYSGSGNKNKTVGDQIFHCHFYPHFAQGMWAMWRVHDVLETGTVMNKDGTVAANSRAYPDGEISTGTPIPGLVPISTLAMAPVPASVSIVDGQIVLKDEGISPGYPFFIPGVAGQRPPHPPLDFAKGDVVTTAGKSIKDTELNGGLPRNVIIDGVIPFENHTKYDWTKKTDSLHAILLPEEGTYYEQLAMETHEKRRHKTLTPRGDTLSFILNGLPRQPGAPYADPAVDEHGKAVGSKRVYKAANIQVDAVLNELGWHYPQQRPIVLWGDVAATISGERPPEPFFMRANSREYIEFWSTNLVPEYYELDDYQVRTPTDIIGQHIHLVKFDVTSSDGAANGWNYEDGTLSADLVRDHIGEINRGMLFEPNLTSSFSGSIKGSAQNAKLRTEPLVAYLPLDIWGESPKDQNWIGAQTTIQRWYADPLENMDNYDRTLRTVFTHDHFGPSTHQQIGLYAGLLIEPTGSKWLNSSTGKPLGFAQQGKTRSVPVAFNTNSNGAAVKGTKFLDIDDGGPTDWQAIIQTVNKEESYREFMFEFQDNQQAYTAESIGEPIPYPEFYYPGTHATSFADSVNTHYRGWIDKKHAIAAPGQPELVTTGNRGTLSLNYRNSPLPVRTAPGGEAKSDNMAYAYSSLLKRGVDVMNSQPTPGYISQPDKKTNKRPNDFIWPTKPLSPGMDAGDPYTPLARAYAGDRIQIRTLVGAHVNPHFFNVHGVKWLFEPSVENSGYRSTQMMSLSEHFEMNFQLPYAKGNKKGNTDYLYVTNADDTGLQAGTWGLMRAHNNKTNNLYPMPNNKLTGSKVSSPEDTGCGCPDNAIQRDYDITAISIDKYQIGGPNWGKLTYNKAHRNFDSKAMLFIHTSEVDNFKNSTTYEPRPLVLRANAGDCINVKLRNDITPGFVQNIGQAKYNDSTIYDYKTSYTVGMHAELVNYDVSTSDGSSVGQNDLSSQLLDIGDSKSEVNYQWYAGQWNSNGQNFSPESSELGTCLLTAPDPLLQYVSGLFGALIVEPENSFWVADQNNPTSANIYASEEAYTSNQAPLFREFVLMFQDNIKIPSEPIAAGIGETVTSGLNYKSEPLASRIFTNASGTNNFNQVNVADIVSNNVVLAAPETPTFVAKAKTPIRFRVMYPGGLGDGTTFDLHGHVWQEEPYQANSTRLGYNPESQWLGARGQLGALNSFDLLINSAGGTFGVPGDYLYRDYRNQTFQDGIWGLFKVTTGQDAPMVTRIIKGTSTKIVGINTVDPTNGKFATSVSLSSGSSIIGSANVNPVNGQWSFDTPSFNPRNGLVVKSQFTNGNEGGSVTYSASQLALLTSKPRQRVRMIAPKRTRVKLIEPGANKSGVLDNTRE